MNTLYKMDNLRDNLTAIGSGGLVGMFSGFKILGVPVSNWYIEFPLKLGGTIILSAVGALVGLVVKDVYLNYIKPYLFKKKK